MASEGDTVHTLTEFGSLPWERLRPEEFGQTWSVARGGSPFRNYEWHIDILRDDLTRDCWAIPPVLAVLFDHFERCGANEVRRTIRAALEIH